MGEAMFVEWAIFVAIAAVAVSGFTIARLLNYILLELAALRSRSSIPQETGHVLQAIYSLRDEVQRRVAETGL